ncbi:MAG: glycosyltransferase [Acidobacteriota bacterium]
MSDVAIVVLAWNQWPMTLQMLDSLRGTDLSGAHVVLVDNGSTDETPARLAERDWPFVIRSEQNLGFVRGNNIGIAAAPPGSDVVLLNNDLEFPDGSWLAKLREAAYSAPDIGVVGCRLRQADGTLLHAGTRILPDTCLGQQLGSLEKDLGQYPGLREVQGVVFACVFIKRAVLDVIGGLSEQFDTYLEDTDFCLRASAAGFKTVVCGDLTLIHHQHGSTQEIPQHREALLEAGRKVFRRQWQEPLEQAYRGDLLWQSIINHPTGYSACTRGFVQALEQAGKRMVYRYVYGAGSVFPIEEAESTGDYLLDVVAHRPLPTPPQEAVVFGQANVFARNIGKYRIGFTMLEVDGFPAEWVHLANSMDEIWVPSQFNARGFLDGGLKRPIHIMPLGFDPDHFHPGIRGFPNPDGEFVFLSCFEWGERKAPDVLLQAFNRTFSAKEPVRLVCKVTNTYANVSMRREILGLGLSESGGRISYLFNRNLPHYQLAALYRSADCFVSPSRGEGWNMPLMEAMACGLPAIATDWGAHQEFVTAEIAYPLRIRGTVPAVAKCPYYEGFSWADPDPDHLSHLLRHVYENRAEAQQRGLLAAAEMRQRWTWSSAAKRILDRLTDGT